VTDIEVYVDPSCPWAWITSRWVKEVAPARDLRVSWPSYCLEIRDDYDVAPVVPAHMREHALAAHALSHRMLRIFEAARAEGGESAVDALYTEWGRLYFSHSFGAGAGAGAGAEPGADRASALLAECLAASGLPVTLLEAASDEKWDAPIVESMEVAYAFGGPKTQTPTIVVRPSDPAGTPYGFKGPVMAPAPVGEAAVRFWDAITVIALEPGFFEITRPRVNRPTPPDVG
jgi:hypothetical protein